MPALWLAAALLVATHPATPDEAAASPVVLVTDGDRFGSGVVWDARAGLVLTALHVVEEMREVRIAHSGEPEQPASIVDRDPALDLALLRAARPLGRAAPVARTPPPARGERARLLGFPGRRASAVEATILDGARRFAGSRYVALSGRAGAGASGGPVVDGRGAVIGIVDLVLTDRDVTLAIPLDAALARFAVPASAAATAARGAPGAVAAATRPQ